MQSLVPQLLICSLEHKLVEFQPDMKFIIKAVNGNHMAVNQRTSEGFSEVIHMDEIMNYFEQIQFHY